MMDNFNKKASDQTLGISLDASIGEFKFVGLSMPEDCQSFFDPVLDWIREYVKAPCETTEVIFDIIYLNTSSSMYVIQILKILQTVEDVTSISIKWHYNEGDDEMVLLGEDLKRISQLDFTLVKLPLRD